MDDSQAKVNRKMWLVTPVRLNTLTAEESNVQYRNRHHWQEASRLTTTVTRIRSKNDDVTAKVYPVAK